MTSLLRNVSHSAMAAILAALVSPQVTQARSPGQFGSQQDNAASTGNHVVRSSVNPVVSGNSAKPQSGLMKTYTQANVNSNAAGSVARFKSQNVLTNPSKPTLGVKTYDKQLANNRMYKKLGKTFDPGKLPTDPGKGGSKFPIDVGAG